MKKSAMPLANFPHLTPLKIWWSIFWRANVKIAIAFIYLLVVSAILTAIILNVKLPQELTTASTPLLEWVNQLASYAKQSPKASYLWGVIIGTVLLAPFYLVAFKKLNLLTYKNFIIKLPDPNNFKSLIKSFIPVYLSWNINWTIVDFLLTFYLSPYLNPFTEVVYFVSYILVTHLVFKSWLQKCLKTGHIILQPRENNYPAPKAGS